MLSWAMNAGKNDGQRAGLFRELARLTGAGIPISQAAKVLQRGRGAQAAATVAGLERGLAGGKSIAGALESTLNPMEWAVVQAAEQSGKLADGFAWLEQYYELRQRTVDRIRAAMLYPVFMLHAAVVLPALVGAVLRGGHGMEIVKAVVLALVLLWAGLALLWLAGTAWARLARTSLPADRVLGWLPVAGPARAALGLARWFTVMHFQITGGQRMSAGLQRAGAASWQAGLDAASQAAASAVEGGATLGEALAAQAAFPFELVSNLTSAEFTGTLDVETLRLTRESMATAAAKSEHAAKMVSAGFYGLVMLFTALQILKIAGAYAGLYSNFMNQL